MATERSSDLALRVVGSAGRYHAPGPSEPNHYAEQLRVEAMSVGTYSIPAGGLDDQSPHDEDEIYVVTAGQGRLTCESETVAVGPGDVLFVPARAEHRFHDVTEDLCLLVVFAPPYSGS
ncbi:MAG: cupin domain-containing protein [Actinomycetota bacterium]|nr:cupin domain-containing protein [Actinomycetota bacterium]